MNKLGRTLFLALAVLLGSLTVLSAQQTYCNGGVVQGVAPWYCSQINQSMIAYWERWAPIALLAVGLSFGIASVLFGAGILLKSERIKNFGIGEYYEAIASAIIVCCFLFIAAVMFGLITGSATGPIDPYSTALNYITQTITGLRLETSQLFTTLTVDGFYVSTSLKYCKSVNSDIVCTSISQFWSWTVLWLYYVPGFVLFDLQFDVLALLYAEFWIILEFMYIAIPVFLIPGIILRSIIPTRGLGGMMIATAIGFYMVLPLLFSVAYYFTSTSTLQCTSSGTLALQTYGDGVGAQTDALNPNGPLVQALNGIQVCMNSYWLSVLFYPSLIMALTYAIISQLSEFIGGMTQLSGRMRV